MALFRSKRPRHKRAHNRTKLGRIRFLTYFGFTMSVMPLASGNIEKSPEKHILRKIFKLTF